MKIKAKIKQFIPTSLFNSIEPTGHAVEALYYSYRYGRPAHGMHVIGVTGTNGKTTTCFMIYQMLLDAGYKVGLMTTVAHGYMHDIKPQMEHMTTVSTKLLNQRLKNLQQRGCEWLVLETTSHALAQHRVLGIPYEIAVFTNLTHEHLDYHGTFERYRSAKRKLFEITNRNPFGFGVVNADDPNASTFTSALEHHETYGIEGGDLRASDIKLTASGSDFVATIGGNNYQIRCNIPGRFNIANSLAAIAVGRRLGLDKGQIERGIANLKNVEGRMNTVDAGQPFSVIVDFAHTPDSFEKLLSDLRGSTNGKLIVLFGSAGRRDESKRTVQGAIAGKYADEVILTEEDDRDIDGNKILDQIAAGAEKSGKTRDQDLFLILDRPSAIRFAMTRAHNAADTVILLGKGHEKTIERADGVHPWNETDQALQAIKARSSAN